jgi:hypothetical protein
MQIVQPNFIVARIRERDVVTARSGELRIDVDSVANVHDHNERRSAMFNLFLGQSSDIAFSLCYRSTDGILVTFGSHLFAGLLSFQYEAVPAIQIDVSVIGITINTGRRDEPLKHIGVLTGIPLAGNGMR